MDALAELLRALATLAWPAIIVILLFLFRRNVRELIESAKSRRFTVKVAGNELTMEEISEQQRNLISDLQQQVVDLQSQLQGLSSGGRGPAVGEGARILEEGVEGINRILWVDDEPKRKAMLIQSFQEQGIDVITALSTEEALRKLSRGSRGFDRVITDMGRFESGKFNPFAGIELTRRIRPAYPDIPIILFTSAQSAWEKREQALAAGVTEVTSSATGLLKLLRVDA